MITEDTYKMPTILDGQKVMVGKFAQTLRRSLWMEHLNLSEEQVRDPLNDNLIEQMNTFALVNKTPIDY